MRFRHAKLGVGSRCVAPPVLSSSACCSIFGGDPCDAHLRPGSPAIQGCIYGVVVCLGAPINLSPAAWGLAERRCSKAAFGCTSRPPASRDSWAASAGALRGPGHGKLCRLCLSPCPSSWGRGTSSSSPPSSPLRPQGVGHGAGEVSRSTCLVPAAGQLRLRGALEREGGRRHRPDRCQLWLTDCVGAQKSDGTRCIRESGGSGFEGLRLADHPWQT